jgi:hypothetical protein
MMQPVVLLTEDVPGEPNGSTTSSPYDLSHKDTTEQPNNDSDYRQFAVNGDLWDVIRKTAHNSHLSVSQIPPEVLEAIFLRLLESIRASSPRGTAALGSFNFIFVCRRWYEVAGNSQSLWCHWDSKAERWPTFLDRSKRAPLHLRFFSNSNSAQGWDDKTTKAAAEMFQSLEVQSRFVDVDFHGARHFVEMYLALSKGWSRPEHPSPLKSLRLRPADDYLTRDPSHTPIVVPSHYWLKLFLELDELELHDCRCDWDAPVFFTSSLKRLSVVCRNPVCNPKMPQIESMIYHNRALYHLELSAPLGCQPSQTLSPSLPFLRTLGVFGALPDATTLLQYLNSPRTLESLHLVLTTDPIGGLDFGGPFLRGFHAQRTTVRWVDVELKNSSVVVRSYSSIDNTTEPFSIIEINQGHRSIPTGTKLWNKLNIHAVCSAALPLESVEKLSIRGEGEYRPGWPRDLVSLFDVLSPTLGEIEAVGNRISSGIMEALTMLPPSATRSSGFNLPRSQLPNLRFLRLVDVDLEGYVEDAPVPFHRFLKHCIENRRDAGPRTGVGRLNKLEIHHCKSGDLDDGSKFITHV